MSAQAACKADPCGVLVLLFLPGRGSELQENLPGSLEGAGGALQGKAQPKAVLSLAGNRTGSAGPKGFCAVQELQAGSAGLLWAPGARPARGQAEEAALGARCRIVPSLGRPCCHWSCCSCCSFKLRSQAEVFRIFGSFPQVCTRNGVFGVGGPAGRREVQPRALWGCGVAAQGAPGVPARPRSLQAKPGPGQGRCPWRDGAAASTATWAASDTKRQLPVPEAGNSRNSSCQELPCNPRLWRAGPCPAGLLG